MQPKLKLIKYLYLKLVMVVFKMHDQQRAAVATFQPFFFQTPFETHAGYFAHRNLGNKV